MKARILVKGLWQSGPGKIGLILLGILAVVSLIVVITYPPDFGLAQWSNPALWADNPKAVPPVWSDIFTPGQKVSHLDMDMINPTEESSSDGVHEKLYRMSFDHQSDEAPTFLSISLSNVEFVNRSPQVMATLIRPDEGEIQKETQRDNRTN